MLKEKLPSDNPNSKNDSLEKAHQEKEWVERKAWVEYEYSAMESAINTAEKNIQGMELDLRASSLRLEGESRTVERADSTISLLIEKEREIIEIAKARKEKLEKELGELKKKSD